MPRRCKKNHPGDPPDGGWGWFVVLSSFLMNTFVLGTVKSFGVFFPYFMEAFGGDAGNAAWIGSIQAAGTLFTSVVAGALCNVFGCRTVVMTGSLVATTGLISSMFVTSLPVMYVTTGLITGVGFSFMYTPCLTMVGRYFKKRRALANGIGMAGSGAGTFILPPLFNLFIDSYGWRPALLLVAGTALQGLVYGALLRPIYLKEDIKPEANTLRSSERISSESVRKCITPSRLVDLSLLKMPYFVVLTVSNIFYVFGQYIPIVHLVAHAKGIGIESQKAAFLVSIFGITDAPTRIVYSWLSDTGLFVRLRGYIVCNVGMGLTLVLWPFAQTYPAMVACCVSFGVFTGCYFSQSVVFLAEFCGVHRLASAVGMFYCLQGFANLFGPPAAGRLYDFTGSYNVSFYVAGGAVFCNVLMLVCLEIHRTRTAHRQHVTTVTRDDVMYDVVETSEEPTGSRKDDCDMPFIVHETNV